MSRTIPPPASGDAYKGTALTTFLEWYVAEHSSSALRAALERLPKQHRHVVEADHPTLGILQGTWYPAGLVHALLDTLFEGMSVHDRTEVAKAAGRVVIESLISGLYAGLFRAMATPALYAKYAPKLWRSYYRQGELSVDLVGPGEVHVTIRDWPGHHDMVCEINRVAGGVIFERMGCLQVEAMRVRCVSRGASHCEVHIQYAAGVRG